jgi:hypothetical protein
MLGGGICGGMERASNTFSLPYRESALDGPCSSTVEFYGFTTGSCFPSGTTSSQYQCEGSAAKFLYYDQSNSCQGKESLDYVFPTTCDPPSDDDDYDDDDDDDDDDGGIFFTPPPSASTTPFPNATQYNAQISCVTGSADTDTLGAGAIAGIVIGSVAAALLLAALAWFLFYKKVLNPPLCHYVFSTHPLYAIMCINPTFINTFEGRCSAGGNTRRQRHEGRGAKGVGVGVGT